MRSSIARFIATRRAALKTPTMSAVVSPLRRGLTVSLLASMLAAFLSVTGPAQLALATYPGTGNGRLAFGMQRADGNIEIFSVRPNGHGLRQLTDVPGFNACAAYSPDGKEIAFCSNRTGAFEIWTMRANGKRQKRLVRGVQPAWQPRAVTQP